jgi:hypothetical protein
MRRLPALVATAVSGLLLAGGIAALRLAAPDPLVAPRPGFWQEAIAANPPKARPGVRLVVWLGDSTVARFGETTYPNVVRERVLGPAGVDSLVRAGLGFTALQYYCVLGPVLDAHPALVILVLNLRTMRTVQDSEALLCSRLPARALVQAATLPLADADMALPRLLLAQSLRWSVVRRGLRLLDVAREDVDAARASLGLPPRIRTGGIASRAQETVGPSPRPSDEEYLASWTKSLRLRSEAVTMLSASVRLAASSGTPVLVVLSPIPVAVLTEAGVWDPGRFTRSLDRLRAVVAQAGGRLVDLHDVVDTSGFRHGGVFDLLSAHLNASGAAAVAERLGPIVARELGLPAS